MHMIGCSIGALAVAFIYYTYRAYLHEQIQNAHTLRARVVYMLWVMANQARSAG